QLSERLAEVEASLGHGDVAGEIYLSLAGQLPKKDDQGRLVYLKKAFTYRPGDTTLGQLIQDMVTGQHTLRRARRRRRVALGAGLVTLFALGTAGVVEIVTAHRVMQVLEGNLGDITAGRPSAAVHELDAVWARYGWTVSGRHAGRLAEQLLTAEIRHLEGLLRTGDYAAVLERLEWLERQVSRADIRQRLGALVERTRLEQQASALFLKVNGQPKPDATALKALSELTEPGHLDFILGRLSDPGTKPHATQALLASLQKIDSPRSFLVVARLYQKSTDARVDELAKAILMRARHHRLQGREDSWSGIYPELEAAQGARAKQILQWLRGD
ncbi:MAG: hypothetical protein ACYS5W_23825, partial [Planctomycetota bacterium]